MTSTWIFAAVFLGFLLLAARTDALDLRIPNSLTLAMAVSGLFAVWLLEGSATMVLVALLAGAVTLAVGWLLFALGWLGGGDVKLAASAAIWLGFEPMLVFVLATAIFGAFLAMMLLMASRSAMALRTVGDRWRSRLTADAISVPYALAMAPAGAVGLLARFPDLLNRV